MSLAGAGTLFRQSGKRIKRDRKNVKLPQNAAPIGRNRASDKFFYAVGKDNGNFLMKKICRALTLLILSLSMILTVFPSTAVAAESVFEPRLSAPSRSNAYYNKQLNYYSQTGYGMPNCVAYAYGRIYEITGEEPLIKRGSASEWWSINKKNGYYNYGQEPQIGAIACWSNHVAIVEKIDGNTVTASQSHWGGNYFDTTTFKSGTNRFGQKFYGYIYACEKINEEVEQEKAEEEARIAAEEKAAEDAKRSHTAVPAQQPEYIVPETSSAPSVSANLTGEEPKIVLNSIVLKKTIEKQNANLH